MKRAAVGVLFPLLLLVMGSAAVPVSVSAVGDCVIGYAIFKDKSTSSAGWMFCYGVHDEDVEGEPGRVFGPTVEGEYHSDWDNLTYRSGANSVEWAMQSGFKLCVYTGKDFTGVVTTLAGNGAQYTHNTNWTDVYTPGSFLWTNVGGCAAG